MVDRPALLVALAILAGAACAPTVNYLDPAGPRFAADYAAQPQGPTVRVVSFNVKYARRIDEAVAAFRAEERLRGADLIALQEMDASGVDCLARSLALNYVYYPAVRHPTSGRDFGNALLSPWPLLDDRKILLPHRGRARRSLRIAVGATALVRGRPLRAYSVHLETAGSVSGRQRREQVEAVLADARTFTGPVVVAGDFNSTGVLAAFVEDGWVWPTRGIGRTISLFSWDHVVARGLTPVACAFAGRVPGSRRASDHVAVWAELLLPREAAAP